MPSGWRLSKDNDVRCIHCGDHFIHLTTTKTDLCSDRCAKDYYAADAIGARSKAGAAKRAGRK